MSDMIPLRRRPLDIFILMFFFVNLFFITYIVDLEQLVIADPVHFNYPVWPPSCMVDLVHWWGRNFDPVLMARPVWWKATIWIDVLFFGPFYAAAIYAFITGREWIRVPSLVYSGVMMANVTIILNEEMWGQHPTPEPGMVLLANAPWLIFPMLIIYRMRREGPVFTRDLGDTQRS